MKILEDQPTWPGCLGHLRHGPLLRPLGQQRAVPQHHRQAPPQPPATAKDYTQAGLPWFDYYDHDRKALAGAAPLAGLDSLAAKMIKVGKKILPGNEPVTPKRVVVMEAKGKVSDGRW